MKSQGEPTRVPRRTFLQVLGAGAVAIGARMPVMAGPFDADDYATRFAAWVPADKKLSPEWVKSLSARGEPAVYHGEELRFIGMPVGGLCAGQLYLGGDGKLWHWDIFNQHIGTGDSHYAHPPVPDEPLEQAFAIRISTGGKTQTRALDRRGFSDVRFRGEFPIARVEYHDPGSPVIVTLEAFSPFIPLDVDDSSLPATILRYTVRNTSSQPLEATIAGWLQNAVCASDTSRPVTLRNRIVHGNRLAMLECLAEQAPQSARSDRQDIVFEDWDKPTYEGWTVEGTAFGKGPIDRDDIPKYQGDVGGEGRRVVNSHATAPGQSVEARDAATGKLTSKTFVVERDFITAWIGGGNHRDKTCLNLLADGKVVRTLTGDNNNRMRLKTIDVRQLKGKEAVIEIVDQERGGWGNIGVGRITFTDRPPSQGPVEQMHDFGTMVLGLLGSDGSVFASDATTEDFDKLAPEIDAATRPPGEKLVGGIGRKVQIAPGESTSLDFVVAWHFPNLELDRLGKVGRHYAKRFDSARAVAQYVTDRFDQLTKQTTLWRDTWYDSTLPYWFLDRVMANTSILATSTAFCFADGRFYGWEGVGCCAGTCTHVWHYAHAPARLFPELERTARERTDLQIGLNESTGVIGFRAEFDRGLAVDGQAGTLLRCYREHLISADDSFLRRNWPRIRKAYEPLLNLDPDGAGVLQGAQMNTLDQPWYGKISWLSSLYVAALRAGEAMARLMGEEALSKRMRTIADAGGRNISDNLFNGEYFVQLPDPSHRKTVGSYDGCEIDQVFGQSWALAVGLGRVLDEAKVKTALASLWKYNFTPDVGPFRAAHERGRWYAMAGEAGLLMCSWPRGEGARVAAGFDYYFNECMTGFEYQAAGHMIWEGMVEQGLAIARAIHDRYHPSKRNPWNEVECGDHYARAMAVYGVYLAACGYEYDGPAGILGFAPRLTPDNFRAAFTAAQGWGTFEQKREGAGQCATVVIKWGKLSVRKLKLESISGNAAGQSARVWLDGKPVDAVLSQDNRAIEIAFASPIELAEGQTLTVQLSA
jgi:non-lysosomal glucosylceramidase